jgi:16S rRNA processing protein RimM
MVVMGRLLAPYGIKGWVKLRTYSESPDTLLAYDTWWLGQSQERTSTEQDWRPFRVVAARQHADTLVAELDGLATREDAFVWRGAWVALPRAELPKPRKGEHYLADLLGLVVVNRSGVTLGRVTGLLESGAHPVLRVLDDGGGERLIPMVPVFIDSIDAKRGEIAVDWQPDY